MFIVRQNQFLVLFSHVLLFFGLQLSGMTVLADEVTDLFEVRVSIESQDRKLRNEAIRKAFEEVLVRVSGRTDIVQSNEYPAIQTAIESATRYARQYRYLKVPAQEGQDTGQSGKDQLVLWARFDDGAIARLLRSSNLPVWGTTRPATLIWLVVDERGQRKMIGNNSQHPALPILLAQAKTRGLPIRMPLLDLNDQSNLRVSDVWGNFESTILRASQRYQTEAVLVGRVYQGYGGWNARWSLYSDNRRRDWSLNGASLEQVLIPGIDTTAETLAVRYAQVVDMNSARVLVEVRDIKGLADYNKVLNYFKTISNVSNVQPYEVKAHSTIFELTTGAGRLGIARAIALGHELASEPVETSPVPDLPGQTPEQQITPPQKVTPDLVYRYVP